MSDDAITGAAGVGPGIGPAPETRVAGARTLTATVVRLKLRLLGNSLRKDAWQVLGVVLGYLAAAGIAAGLVFTAVILRWADADVAQQFVIGVGFAGTLLWIVVPLVTFGLDETVDPARFALLPVGAGTLLPGLLLAAAIGAPGLATLLAGLATTVTWARGPEIVLAPVFALVGVATCLVASRVVTTAAAGMLSARRGREAAAAITAVVAAGIGVVPPAITALVTRADDSGIDLGLIAQGLGWTPLGAPWAVAGDVAVGHPWRALARGVIAVGVLVLLLLAWRRLLARSLESPAGGSTRRGGGGSKTLFDRLPANPTIAVAVRMLLSFRRDSRYLVALAAPLILAVVLGVGSRGTFVGTWFGPVFGAFAAGLISCNAFGYDGSAFAAHLITSVTGKADLGGRALALLSAATPIVALAAVLGALVGGTPARIPLLLAVGVGVLFITVGAGSVVSVLAPYPLPPAGSNPFGSRTYGGLRPFVAQLVLMALMWVVVVPAVVLTVIDNPVTHVAAHLVPPLIGGGGLAAGLALAVSLYDKRGPEVLAAVRREA